LPRLCGRRCRDRRDENATDCPAEGAAPERTTLGFHRSLRKVIKTRGSFPIDEAALKLLFSAIRNAGVHWRRPVEWTAAIGQFAILLGGRFAPSAR
jgi:putative transposase